MTKLNPQYITDQKGNKISVILPIKDFQALLEEIEELEDVALYDEGKKSKSPSIPIEKAFQIIESKRKNKASV
ncbi:MAG TPA: hypothetical protein PKD85_12715 [Saprospiraceae bacterium]|nr:hypothetical protein [Saprospiraceae bacterium]